MKHNCSSTVPLIAALAIHQIKRNPSAPSNQSPPIPCPSCPPGALAQLMPSFRDHPLREACVGLLWHTTWVFDILWPSRVPCLDFDTMQPDHQAFQRHPHFQETQCAARLPIFGESSAALSHNGTPVAACPMTRARFIPSPTVAMSLLVIPPWFPGESATFWETRREPGYRTFAMMYFGLIDTSIVI